MPQGAVWGQLQPPAVLLGINHEHPAWTDHQMIEVGLGAGDAKVVQDHPAVTLQAGQKLGGAPLAVGAVPPGAGFGTRTKAQRPADPDGRDGGGDRKSTRLNSSHGSIAYAVLCLKKKK